MTSSAVFGATGRLGRRLVRELAERGHYVVAVGRQEAKLRELVPTANETRSMDLLVDGPLVESVCSQVDYVFACVGASVLPGRGHGWRGYEAVDSRANRSLISAARATRVRGFVYVAVAAHEQLGDLAYVEAHERVVRDLRDSGLPYGVIRPTGFYGALALLVDMAAKGPLPLVGDGSARTNPIHEADVAASCADAILDLPIEREIGGPEVLSRRDIAAQAFAAVGKTPRYRKIPPVVLLGMAGALRPFHPRLSQLMAFVGAVSTRDVIAPGVGARKLLDYFEGVASGADGTG